MCVLHHPCKGGGYMFNCLVEIHNYFINVTLTEVINNKYSNESDYREPLWLLNYFHTFSFAKQTV